MKKNLFSAIITGLLFCSCTSGTNWQSYSGDKEIERKVDSVLSLMTLEEKIGQMTQFTSFGDITGPQVGGDIEPYLKKGLVGNIFNAVTTDGIRKLQELALSESRLKIPVLFGYDVVHGFKTIFPMPLAESCSWDLERIEESASIAAAETAAAGIKWTFAPMVDIARDPRWGRVMEGAGEDPYLGSRIAEARVRGFQGNTWQELKSPDKILACAKHFVAYGAAEAGRDYNVTDMSERTLRDLYFPPFQAAQKAGVGTFMTAFNEISGVPCTASKYLFTDILREEWNFNGFVVTDYTAINELVPHGVARDEKQAGELAANAGVDMDMTGSVYLKHLKNSVEEGKVPVSVIDNAVRRILEMKFLLGLFDDPYACLDPEREKSTIMKPEFLQAAREMAARSAVLLKNENHLLPINKNQKCTVALIGPMIKNKESLNGEWAGQGNRQQSVSLFEGLTEKYDRTNVRFIYAPGCDLTTDNEQGFTEALSAARQADIILFAGGEDYNWSGEAACRTDIKLPGAQQALLKQLKKTGKPIILVLFNGRPLDLSWEDRNLNAILEAWYPGTMGGHAVADIIAGDYNPSGRLTLSFPRNVGQIPVYYNHKNTGRPASDDTYSDYRSFYLDEKNAPLYPFGYGLSYTVFEIGNMQLNKTEIKKGEPLVVTAEIRNAGDRDGEQVVQLYVRDMVGSVSRPVKELKRFAKIFLKKGEKQTVRFEISSDDLAFHNLGMHYTSEPGDFKIWIADSSDDERQEKTFRLIE